MSVPPIAPDPRAQISGLVFALLVLDPDLEVVEVNPAAEDLIGQSAKRLIGTELRELLDLEGSGVEERLDRDHAQLIARGVTIRILGRERRVNLTVSPLSTYPGWRVLTLTDAGQDDMADNGGPDIALKAPSILAHEIKNPLAAIRGAGQLIARKLDKGDRGLTQVISQEVDRIARLIDRMQELGSNAREPVGPVNLHESVRKAIATVRAGAGDRVAFAEEFDPSLPPVLANRDQLEQVLINLLSNAVDACRAVDDPRISIRTRFVSGLAARVFRLGVAVRLPIEVSVTDNGSGIDPAVADHLFEPFVTNKKNGQGLGLSLVRKMVADMGGRVSYRRDPRASLTIFQVHLAVAASGGENADG